MTSSIYIILDSIKREAIEMFNEKEPYQDIIEAIITIDDMSNIGRKEGLLALEEYTQGESGTVSDDISYGVRLVVDGAEPDLVAEITINKYLLSNYVGNNALKQFILIRGLLAVQEGLSTIIIEELLTSLLPSIVKEQAMEDLKHHREIMSNTYNK